MRILTLRYINGEFVVTAPNLEAVSSVKARGEALVYQSLPWVVDHGGGPGCSKWAA